MNGDDKLYVLTRIANALEGLLGAAIVFLCLRAVEVFVGLVNMVKGG